MPWSTGSSQSPEQSPEGHNCAPRREQLPKQLLPSPQVASSIVLFGWQQWTVTDSLEKVKMFSKKLIALSFPVIHIISSCFPISLRLWNTFHFVHMFRKIPPDILEGKESVSASSSPVWNMTDCGTGGDWQSTPKLSAVIKFLIKTGIAETAIYSYLL